MLQQLYQNFSRTRFLKLYLNFHFQAYLKGEDIALIKRLIQLHIMTSRQKREDARIAALIEEEEEDEADGDDSVDMRTSFSSDPGLYKYEEPNVDDVEREVMFVCLFVLLIIRLRRNSQAASWTLHNEHN